MKNKLLLLFTLFFSAQAFAQKIELSPSVGWLFSGAPSTNIDIKNNVVYGLGLTYMFNEAVGVDVNYNYCSSSLRVKDNYFAPAHYSGKYNFDQGYITIGIVKTLQLSNDKIVPYSRVGLGMMYVDVKDVGLEPQYRFAGTLEGGV